MLAATAAAASGIRKGDGNERFNTAIRVQPCNNSPHADPPVFFVSVGGRGAGARIADPRFYTIDIITRFAILNLEPLK